MKNWEYRVENRDTLDEGTLNTYGDSGWELVQIHRTDTGQLQTIFKREKKRGFFRKKMPVNNETNP